MTTNEKRLDRLYPALTAKERAILTLADYKEGRAQDHQLRYTAPESQARAFNQLIGVIHAASGDIAFLILMHREQIRQTELRLAWLLSMRSYGLQCSLVREHMIFDMRQPIKQSGYDELERKSREELIPIRECAEILADRHVWLDGDLVELDGEREPTESAWRRAMRDETRRLRLLVGDGILSGRGRGSHLKITSGSFFDWLREPVPVLPDWGIDFEVYPDERAEEVEGLSKRRVAVLEVIDRLAVPVDLPLELEDPVTSVPAGAGLFDEQMRRSFVSAICTEVKEHWLQLLTYGRAVAEMTEAFDGEDVLPPVARAALEEAKATVVALHESLQRYSGPFDLPDAPDIETLAFIERAVQRELPLR